MKNLYLIITILSFFAFQLKAQNVDYQIYTTEYYTGNANSDFWTADDPKWIVLFYDNTDGYSTGNGVLRSIENGLDGPAWDNPADYLCKTATNASATGIKVSLESWEDDTGNASAYDSGDDYHCGASLSGVIPFRNDPLCTWNTYQYDCDANWKVKYRIYWNWASAPVISAQPTANYVYCQATSPSAISFTTSADVSSSKPVTTWYKWQIAKTASGPWTDIPGATNATRNTSTNTFSYTPYKISGTRYYRALATSNCSADFSTQTTTTNVVTVTYAFVTAGAYSTAPGSFPNGVGDGIPPIQSPICGGSITPGQAVTLGTIQAPAAGHVANATYSWSASGGTLSTPTTNSSVVWTSPLTTGPQTITLTYTQGGCTSTQTVCATTVGDPSCNFIYVSQTGSDAVSYASGGGGPGNPFATISYAVSQANINSIGHIKVANGNYTENQTIDLIDSITIEGGYQIGTGVWTKNSNSTTNITITDGAPNTSGLAYHYIGVRSDSDDNWKLIDLNISTTARTGNYSSQRGNSNYALWINNSSGYELIRCKITAGAGGDGGDGSGYASNGGAGATTGGAGGSGASGNGNPSGGNAGSAGSAGTGGPGTGGGGGAGGTVADNCGSSSGCNSGGCNGNDGGTGGAGTDGGSYIANDRPTNSIVSGTYFVPAGQSPSGGGGGGGGHGSGGTGSRGGRSVCINCSADNGGTGGDGGDGGNGGMGGYGAGGSFGIWTYNSTAGSVFNPNLNIPASVSVGGSGASGQAAPNTGINTGRSNGSCNSCVAGSRCSGDGGYGGSGGNGGRGRDGANGLNAKLVVNGVATNPTTTITTTPVIEITYNDNMMLCKNSVFNISKISGTGNWTKPANFDYVKYVNAATGSEFSASSTSADLYPTNNTTGFYDLQSGTLVFNDYLHLESDNRPLPVISITDPVDNAALVATNQICVGGSVKAINNVAFNTKVDYKWEVYSGSSAPTKASGTGSAVFTSNTANPTFGPFTTAGTYIVRYQEKDRCCGWSIPVFTTITVQADPSAPSGLIKDPTALIVCEGASLTVNTPSGVTGGVSPLSYEYYYTTPSTTTSYSGTAPSFAAEIGANKVSVRVVEVSKWGCDASAKYDVSWTGVEDPKAGDIGKFSPLETIVCEGTLLEVEVNNASGGAGTIADPIEYYLVSPSGGAAPSGATSGTTYVGPITSSPGDYYFRTKRTASGLDCDDSGWKAWTFIYNVSKAPTISAAVDATYLCDNTAELTGVTDLGTGTWSKVTAGGYAIVSPTSANTGVNTLTPGTPVDIKWKVTNGACKDSTNVTISLQTLSGALVSTATCNDCIMVDANSRTYYSGATGDYMARIEDLSSPYPTATIGATELCVGFDASVQHVVDNEGADQPYLQRYWTIKPVTNTDVEVKLYFTATELSALQSAASSLSGGKYAFSSVNELEMVKYPNGGAGSFTTPASSGGVVIVPTFTGPVSGVYTATFMVNSFSTFYIYPASYLRPLPVELIDFTAKAIDNKFISLRWSTATEINNEGFDIERSTDGINFEKIGHLSGNGNSNVINHYSYQDNNVAKGIYYYRLKQIDFDGVFEYSEIRNASILGGDKLSVSFFIPNPAENQSSLNFEVINDTKVSIEIYDGIGRKVIDRIEFLTKGKNTISFNTTDLAAGVYSTKILVNDEEFARKLVIRK